MKQGTQISAPIGTGAATLCELSNDSPKRMIPRLTVMMPAYTDVSNQGYSDAFQVNYPAQSILLKGDRCRELYDFLHGYYSATPTPSLGEDGGLLEADRIEAAIKAGVECGMFPKMMFIDQGAELRKQMAIVLRAAQSNSPK